MLATQIEVSDGTLDIVNVGFPFFEQEDITVALDQGNPLVLGVDYQWMNSTTIQFLNTANTPGGLVPNGVEVIVRRDTQNEEMYNIYDGGAPFSRTTLDENFKQLLYLSQEFSEGLGIDGLRNNLNMNGYRVVGLGDGIDDQDAATKGQMDDLVEGVEAGIREDFTSADASLQAQILGTNPPMGSAFSVISWHDQIVTNSIVIPDNKNAWSFGPSVTVDDGVTVTIGDGSFWTVATGAEPEFLTAQSLTTPRNITANGDGSWTVLFDGSADVSAAFTLAATGTAGTYGTVTTDSKGRVTSGTVVTPVINGGTGAATPVLARAALGVVNASQGYIEGLCLVWNSAASLTVSTGAAYIPALGDVLDTSVAITKAGLTLTASTWYHVYVFSNAGVMDAEVVTTAPSAKYHGTARTKTGDTTRRYVGSVLATSANTMLRFKHSGVKVSWLADIATAPLALLANGQQTTATTVACGAAVPVTATHISAISLANNTGAAALFINDPDMGTVSGTNNLMGLGTGQQMMYDMSLSSAQAISYIFNSSPGAGGFVFRCSGYLFER